MSYIVGEETGVYQLGTSSAELDEGDVERFGLAEGLQKLGRQLLEQFPAASGVKITGVEIIFCLKPKVSNGD